MAWLVCHEPRAWILPSPWSPCVRAEIQSDPEMLVSVFGFYLSLLTFNKCRSLVKQILYSYKYRCNQRSLPHSSFKQPAPSGHRPCTSGLGGQRLGPPRQKWLSAQAESITSGNRDFQPFDTEDSLFLLRCCRYFLAGNSFSFNLRLPDDFQ